MEHLRRDWSEFLAYAKNFIEEPFTMIDVGCSGGIDEILKNFGDKIVYYGFDPNVEEIKLLKEKNTNPNINYIEAFVYCGEASTGDSNSFSYRTKKFEESSAWEGRKIVEDEVKSNHRDAVNNNLWDLLKLSHTKVKISDFIKEKRIQNIDFVKTDLDGLDLGFFKASEEIFDQLDILSVVAEVSFGSNTNDESDLTNLLKKHGYTLSLLSTRKYSSKHLPDLFSLNIEAQTLSGTIFQGDALYIKGGKRNLSPQKLLKFAIIMDLFNLPDCAAEIFVLYRSELEMTGIDVEKSLDLLTKQRKFLKNVSYKNFIRKFYDEHDLFHPKSYSSEELVEIFGENVSRIEDGSFYRIMDGFRKRDIFSDRKKSKLKKLCSLFRCGKQL